MFIEHFSGRNLPFSRENLTKWVKFVHKNGILCTSEAIFWGIFFEIFRDFSENGVFLWFFAIFFSQMFFASHGTLSPSALISPHKFNKYHEYLSLRDVFLPQITQIIKIFFFFWFACFRRCLKLCSTDYTDFLSLRDVLFLSRMFCASHGTLSLISPHKFNKYHEYLSLRDVFLPQISLIVTNYNFFSHRLHRLKRFFLFFFDFSLCSRFCFA